MNIFGEKLKFSRKESEIKKKKISIFAGRSALELLYAHVPSVEQAWNAAAYEWTPYNPYDYIQ